MRENFAANLPEPSQQERTVRRHRRFYIGHRPRTNVESGSISDGTRREFVPEGIMPRVVSMIARKGRRLPQVETPGEGFVLRRERVHAYRQEREADKDKQ